MENNKTKFKLNKSFIKSVEEKVEENGICFVKNDDCFVFDLNSKNSRFDEINSEKVIEAINQVKQKNNNFKHFAMGLDFSDRKAYEKYRTIHDEIKNVEGMELYVTENSTYISKPEYWEQMTALVDSWAEQINSAVNLQGKSLTPLEKFFASYKIVTRFEYVSEKSNSAASRSLPLVLGGNKIVCVGFAQMLNNLLERVGIKSDAICTKPQFPLSSRADHRVLLFALDDEKYDSHGVFISDPTKDAFDPISFDGGCNIDYSVLNYNDYESELKNTICLLDEDKIDSTFDWVLNNLSLIKKVDEKTIELLLPSSVLADLKLRDSLNSDESFRDTLNNYQKFLKFDIIKKYSDIVNQDLTYNNYVKACLNSGFYSANDLKYYIENMDSLDKAGYLDIKMCKSNQEFFEKLQNYLKNRKDFEKAKSFKVNSKGIEIIKKCLDSNKQRGE